MFVQTTPKFVGFSLTISFYLLVSFSALAQNEVAIGSATTKPNAILWLNGNGSQGLLLPVVTNKSAVSNPEKGMFIYDDSDNKVWYWNFSAWVEAGGSGTGSGTVTTVTGTSPVVVTNPNTTPEISLADGGITNAKLANDAITSAKIQDATITGSDISNTTISVDKLAQSGALSGQVLKWNGTNWVPQNDDVGVGSVPTLNNGQLLIGNGTTNTAATVSGDATLSAGVLTITNGVISGGTGGKITDATITNADIANAAAIEVTKLAIGANGQVLTTIAGVPTWTVGSTGTVTSIAAGTGLTGGPITSTGTLSVDVGTTANKIVQLDGTGRLPAVDGSQISGLNASNISAGLLPLSRITAGTAGEVLTTVAGVPAWQAPVTGVTTLDGLTDAAIAAPASGQVLVNDGAGQFRNVSMSGDAGISAAGALTIANGAISGGVGGKIADATIAAADLAAGSVSGGVGGVVTDASITSADLAAGSVSGGAAGIITDATITNADIAGSAAIAVTKVAAGANGNVLTTVAGVPTWQAPVTGATTLDGLTDATVAAPASGQILVNNGAGQFVNVTMSGDASISGAGALTIANGAISGGVGGKITDATIVAADLAAGSVSGGVGGIITDGTVTTVDITDGTVTNIDIAGAASIAVTKVAAGADGNVLTTVAGVPTWAAPAGGFSTLNTVPKGNGTTLVASNIYDVGGNVGIGEPAPVHTLDVYGILYQTYGYTYFNQSLDASNGNMGVGGTAYPDIKLNVDTDLDYGIWVTNTSPGGYSAYLEGDVVVDGYLDVTGDTYVNGVLDVVGDAYVAGDTYLTGNLDVVGALSKGSGTFKIDHPLDPQNKILYHSFVESPDMMNVYNGNVITDGQGEVTVTLPDYFEALNKDFRYQLTAIGTFAQAIIYKKIANNSFVIKTDKPNVEVSWQVTGIRKDPYAEKNRVVPEVAKTGDQIGKYLYPEAYGISSKAGNSAQRKPPSKRKAVLPKASMEKATTQKPTRQKP